ncbi:hypothetical protein PoB_001254500 [Plakobranchus ocellatus]|uniref:Uncharacterized protein n=1 Tax=Plakobranchus ocellatus TaxID=259542 RepID=A0AAV3YTD2_9GAST|nr:hypothetical protein PoB_001254500 [Plakobranchus ocellatus]
METESTASAPQHACMFAPTKASVVSIFCSIACAGKDQLCLLRMYVVQKTQQPLATQIFTVFLFNDRSPQKLTRAARNDLVTADSSFLNTDLLGACISPVRSSDLISDD